MTATLDPGTIRYAGGLTIIIWRNLQAQGPVTVLVRNCTFTNNTASINENNANDSKTRPSFYVPQGHGGAIMVLFDQVTNHTVWIQDSVIKNNTALFNGGGLFISFFNSSFWNRVIISGSLVKGNKCNNVRGGGLSMNTFQIANFNQLQVQDTNFVANQAWVGGGACTINLQV